MAPGGEEHLFLGYVFHPKLRWSKDYLTVSIDSLKQGEFSVNRTRNLRVPLGPWAFPLRDLKHAALETQLAAHNPADPDEAAKVLSLGDQLKKKNCRSSCFSLNHPLPPTQALRLSMHRQPMTMAKVFE